MSHALDPAVLHSFLEEVRSYLPALEQEAGRLRQDPATPGALAEIHRLAHSIRSASEMIGLESLAGPAGRVEKLAEPALFGDCRLDAQALAGLDEALGELHRGLGAPSRDAAPPAMSATTRHAAPDSASEVAGFDPVAAELVDTFLSEAEQLLGRMDKAVAALRARPADASPLLRELRQHAHTLKGAAAMTGLETAAGVAHRMEDVLDLLIAGSLPAESEILDLLQACHDCLADLAAARGDNEELVDRARQALALIAAAASTSAPGDAARTAESKAAGGPAAPEAPAPAHAPAGQQATVRVPVERLTGIARTLSEIFMNASGFEQQIEAFRKELDELSLNLARIRRISSQLSEAQEAATPGAGGAAVSQEATSSASEFDVLEFDRYTRMNLIARDLAEATTDLSALSAQFQSMRAQFDTWAARQRGLSGEAQDQLMRLRMVPLESLLSRLDRTVRVTAAKTGKPVRLEASGLETEFDKSVVEQLAPALEHLLRNAIDHGIELPPARLAAGKPETGTVRLSASRQGAHVTLQLSDDGAGLDFERIARRAVELEWLTAEQAAAASHESLIRLIFEPGFSTAEAVSEISGRGVGMDVVRSTIESLRGRLSVQSRAGHGATFTFVLPVSMAVDRVVILETAGERFALPMNAMTRQMQVFDSQLVERNGQQGVLAGGEWLPACWLGEWLGLAAPEQRPSRCALLFVNNGEREIALLAGRVIEAREIVTKPLAAVLARMTHFSGATILGDGSVVLILNPSAIGLEAAPPLPLSPARRRAAREETVLIVDDSISIRRSVGNLLRSNGWRTLEARDGQEALELLERRASPPDAVLMDIEMPRMDGYELAAALRARPGFESVPLLMLTSRAGDKHRQKALRLGVDRYLVKPCPDELLVAELRNCIESCRGSRLAAG